MSGVTWSKFFWADWRSDPGLRSCGYAARGLWMDLLCIAAEADPVGSVAINGRAMTTEQIARVTGGAVAEVESLLAELEAAGVFSRARNGAIYSRRMVRDAKKAKIAAENGRKGGNPTLCGNRDIPPSDNPPHNRGDKGRDKPHKPEARVQKKESIAQHYTAARATADSERHAAPPDASHGREEPPPPAPPKPETDCIADALADACGADPAKLSAWHMAGVSVARWMAEGATEPVILAVGRAHAARGKGPPRTPSYFDGPIRDALHGRGAPDAREPPAVPDGWIMTSAGPMRALTPEQRQRRDELNARRAR